ncbi:hypothetical protein NW762_007671 [Fusarium torreyae]|uniref:Clr5 domain-containing protein n=1 Tax=Fusarium torreyae TaxID=1237075 RepID=A0A9W8S012_9HYPO|nr:hypothetical protein NW762_007671 [Fusarium torreyae]
MSVSSVTFTAAATVEQWEEMKPAIVDAWLNRASDLKDMVLILKQEYNLVSTVKICRTRLQRWGMTTYKKRQAGTDDESPMQPVRKRKGTKFKGKKDSDPASPSLNPLNGVLSLSDAFRVPEFFFYSIDVFISYALKESLVQQPKAGDLIHPKADEDYSLCWQEIADLYQAAEGYFRGECWKKFVNTIKKAHLELRILVGLPDLQPEDFQMVWQRTMITRFWRICHRLIKLDTLWPQYGYSFLLDFVIEFERLVNTFYGEPSPLGQMLRTIAQIDKEHIQAVVRRGASRSIGVMAPMIDERQRRIVMYAWTDFMYRN